MEGQTRTEVDAEQPKHLDEKKSMFHSVKDKVKKMNAKVRKNIRARQGHEENLEESGGEEEEAKDQDDKEEQDQFRRKSDENVGDVETLRAQNDRRIKDDTPVKEPMRTKENLNEGLSPIKEPMRTKENPNEGLSHFKDTEQGRGDAGNRASTAERGETETDVGIPYTTEKAGDVKAEATESTPQYASGEAGEGNVLAYNTKPPNVDEEIKCDIPLNVTEENKSGPSEKGFGIMSTASGLAQRLKGVIGSKQSSDGDVKDSVLQREDEGKEDGGPQQQQFEAGRVDHVKEKEEEFESNSDPSSGENQEEEISRRLARVDQGKVSEEEGAELASYTKPPNFTEVKSVMSVNTVVQGERQGKEDEAPQLQQSEPEGKGYAAGPNSGEIPKEEEFQQSMSRPAQGSVREEIKSGTFETSPQGLFPRNQSINDNVKDTVLQGESKGEEDERPQQQQSEAKVGQSYGQKLFAVKSAIESKMGYGGQTNQEKNGTRELKSGDPIEGPTSRTGTEAMEDAKEGKKSPFVCKLSPGEDDKALSTVITEAVSNSARSVKDTIVGGFFRGKQKSPTTDETILSPTDTTVGAPQSPTQSIPSNASGGKGIVNPVTGVVGSFVGRKEGQESEISPSSQKQELCGAGREANG